MPDVAEKILSTIPRDKYVEWIQGGDTDGLLYVIEECSSPP